MKKIKAEDLAFFDTKQALKSSMDDMPTMERSASIPVEQGGERKQARKPASKKVGKSDSVQSRKPDSTLAKSTSLKGDIASVIASTLKLTGDRKVFIRVTPEEKRQLKVVLHHFEMQDVRLKENDLGRIALSALIDDFNTNQEKSLLAKVIYNMNIS